MKDIFMEKKFLEYRLNDFLVSFQVWIYETIPAIAQKNYCIKHESQRPWMLSWSSNQHVTSMGLRRTIFYLIKLEVNQIVSLEVEKGEEYVIGLFVEGLGGDQDDDDFEHPVVGLKKLIDEGKTKYVDRAGGSTEKKNKGKINEICRMQSNPIENRLKDVEEMIKTNEDVIEHLQILECKVKKMLAGWCEEFTDETDQVLVGNEEEMKDGMESLPDETYQVYNDFPSFSLGIEFELSCGEKDLEVPVKKCAKAVEKSLRAVDVASPSNKGRIELLEEVELKNDVWEKVVEVKAAIEAKIEIEEGNVETIETMNLLLHQGLRNVLLKALLHSRLVLALRWHVMLMPLSFGLTRDW
ncbi:Hypothetical predicted protein [Olea europaea subsp. europaea]|uniref:Uncharacterized protein n=1 Tax=Olea europaea subsp. europaea TaxID=158383 RepID=A0A8S0Q6E3_OLEEU|nr:Hypothetical predicted protein [Olea europaea subsp. europaea]